MFTIVSPTSEFLERLARLFEHSDRNLDKLASYQSVHILLLIGKSFHSTLQILHSLEWKTSLNVFFYYNLIKTILSLNYDDIKRVDKETIYSETKRIFLI